MRRHWCVNSWVRIPFFRISFHQLVPVHFFASSSYDILNFRYMYLGNLAFAFAFFISSEVFYTVEAQVMIMMIPV